MAEEAMTAAKVKDPSGNVKQVSGSGKDATSWYEERRARFWFRAVLWVSALALCLYLTLTRFASVTAAKPTPFDTAILAFTAILILLPFVSEVTAFGVTVKRQIEEVKKELKAETGEIRNELRMMNMTASQSSNVYFQGTPGVPNASLPAYGDWIRDLLQRFQEESGIRDTPPRPSAVPAGSAFAFEQRYQIEREVKRLWSARVVRDDFQRFPNFYRMVDDLVLAQLVTADLARPLKEVYQVASTLMHGFETEPEKEAFLREVGPAVVMTLSAIA